MIFDGLADSALSASCHLSPSTPSLLYTSVSVSIKATVLHKTSPNFNYLVFDLCMRVVCCI